MTVIGPSGCGKSSLLRVVAGLVRPSAGDVLIGGERVNDREPGERDIALVFQSYALYPHMTVRANMEFPLRMRKLPPRERRARASEVAEMLGLTTLLERKPHELSGGQMQRVAIGRALVRRPRAFLLDEPLSNLDTRLREDVRAELRKLFRELGATVLYVTHDQVGAVTLGDRLCVLGEGRVQALGAPLDLVARPPSMFVADLLGAPPLNLVHGRVERGRFRAAPFELDAPGRADGAVVLGLAPGDLSCAVAGEGPDTSRCVVTDVERTGARTVLRVRMDGAPDAGDAGVQVRVVLRGDHDLARGARCVIDCSGAERHWFDPVSGARLT